MKRKTIPLVTKFEVLIRQRGACGCGCGEILHADRIQFDHDPAIELRPRNEAGDDTVPPMNSQRHIVALDRDHHDRKTNGPGGERRITTRGSDNHNARRIARLQAKQEKHRAAMRGKGMQDDQKGGDEMAKAAAAKKTAKKPAKKAAKGKK